MKKTIKGKNDVSIAVEDAGTGQPIIFLHGWPLNQQMFEYQYNYFLAKGYRIIGIDLRGFGDSDLAIEDYGYDTLAEDVKAVVDELEIKDSILVGFSMGGAIASRYMSRYDGHGVKKLVLIGAAAPLFTQRPDYPYGMKKEEVDELIVQAQTDRPKMIQDFGKKLFHKHASTPYKNWIASLAWQASSYGTILSAIALRDEDLRADLPKISAPTLICHGEKDEVCPYEFAEEMAKLIPQNVVVAFEKSGHGIFHDETEKLNETMLRFIQKQV
ncbi:alpha/beta fold hydrolase [Desemzia sp. FAM 23991]|uniref:alpha/beta fold hydrolase n=1 Tax=unclassified Desemzia TaxID=2685243 RepID=UPI00388B675B